MLSELVLPIICKKYNITAILFDKEYKIIEYSQNIKSLLFGIEEISEGEDIRTSFWELIGLEKELENIYNLQKKNLHIPMFFKNNNYYDINIELCEIKPAVKLFIAVITKETKFSSEYSSMIKKINRENLIFENKKKSLENNEYYFNLINKNLISFYVDSNGIITEVNKACLFFFGFVDNEMIGHHFSTFFNTRESNSSFLDNKTIILRATNLDKIDVFFHADIIPIKGKDTINSNIIICQDITYLKRVESELEYAAYYDNLTGLPNRTLLLKKIDELLEKGKKEEITFALCFIDLNKFKNVNDTLGHHAGDMLLKFIGETLKKVVRHCDTVSRIGGDEFIILFDSLGNNDFLTSMLNRIIELENTSLLYEEDIRIPLNFSLGVSSYPDNGVDVKSLLEYADKKMYADKKKHF